MSKLTRAYHIRMTAGLTATNDPPPAPETPYDIARRYTNTVVEARAAKDQGGCGS